LSPAAEIDPGKQWRGSQGIPVVPLLDTYRAIAILGVVLFHIFQVSGVFAALGDSVAGDLSFAMLAHTLDILFLVSGFVMFLPTAARGGEFGSIRYFALRRAARLLPAYWVCLAIALLLLVAVGTAGEFPSLTEIALHVSVLQTPALLFDGGIDLGFGVVPPVWTLSVEVGFYIILPLVAAAYFRRPFVGLATAAAIVVGWYLLGTNTDAISSALHLGLDANDESRIATFYASQLPSWSFALACGMTGAWVFVKMTAQGLSPARQARNLRVTVAAAAVLILVAYVAGREALADPNPFAGLFARQSPLITLGYAAALSVVFVGLTVCPASVRRPFEGRLLRWTGDISYAIYLIHFAVIWFALREFSLPADGSLLALLAWCGLVYPPSFLYAYLSARFIERPVRRWAHRFGRRAQTETGTKPKPATEAS
jgi:peptidoglycan/LPS O-acetylase OafA/YrhL